MRWCLICALSVWCVIADATPTRGAEDAAAALGAVDQQPQAETPPVVERQAGTPKPTPSPVERESREGHLANVRLEVTITDQRGTGQPTMKTVALVLADRANGRIRTTGEIRVAAAQTSGSVFPQGTQIRPVVLNIDAYPEIVRDGRVRARVTLEYKPTAAEATSDEQALTTISETFSVILSDGKPLVVSQSADPTTDRQVRVEVKATILK